MNENNGEDFEDIDFSPEGLGKLMFSKQEVNIILSTDEFDFDTQVLKGQLITQAEMRNMVVRQAKNGSAEAQKLIEKWRQEIAMMNVM
jgi:hypothetical protein